MTFPDTNPSGIDIDIIQHHRGEPGFIDHHRQDARICRSTAGRDHERRIARDGGKQAVNRVELELHRDLGRVIAEHAASGLAFGVRARRTIIAGRTVRHGRQRVTVAFRSNGIT